MLGAVTTGGPSVVVNGWIAIVFIVTGLIISVAVAWKAIWPALRATVTIADQLPFLKRAQEAYAALEAHVDDQVHRITGFEATIVAHDAKIITHENRINAHEDRINTQEKRILALEHPLPPPASAG